MTHKETEARRAPGYTVGISGAEFKTRLTRSPSRGPASLPPKNTWQQTGLPDGLAVQRPQNSVNKSLSYLPFILLPRSPSGNSPVLEEFLTRVTVTQAFLQNVALDRVWFG